MSMAFKVTIDDDQERDLEERAHASGFSMAQLIGGAITDRLFASPVNAEELPDDEARPA
jgi:hypothetical protein